MIADANFDIWISWCTALQNFPLESPNEDTLSELPMLMTRMRLVGRRGFVLRLLTLTGAGDEVWDTIQADDQIHAPQMILICEMRVGGILWLL